MILRFKKIQQIDDVTPLSDIVQFVIREEMVGMAYGV